MHQNYQYHFGIHVFYILLILSSQNASIGDVVFVVMATDRDSGSNGQIAFSFGFGNEDGKFSIHSLSGVISVASRLNYRLTQLYQVGTI